MLKKSLYVILLLAGIEAKAQVPGYQGLRFSLKYDCGIMHPAIIGRRGSWPYLYHNFLAEYVVSRSISVGLMYTYMFYNGAPNKYALPSNSISIDQVALNPNDYKGQYHQHCITFLCKKFFQRKGYIAPVGRYVNFGAYFQYAIDKSIVNQAAGSDYYIPQAFKGTAYIPGIVFGVGRNFIVADRLIIDFGANINVPVYVPGRSGETLVTYRDVLFNNLLQLYLGLGVLAF